MNYDSSLREMSYESSASARGTFIRRTYGHLAGAVLAFVALETVLLQVITQDQIMTLFGRSPWSLLVLMVAFWGASWVANQWAQSDSSVALQYIGLGLYIAVECVIFLPILYVATHQLGNQGQNLVQSAGIMTLCVFGGLTLAAFVSGKDYSSLGPILSVGSMVAFGLILCSILFGFSLGLVFSFAMVALLSGYILYETSQVMLYWPTDKHVAAALMLFSSVATLFYYILRIFMALNSNRD